MSKTEDRIREALMEADLAFWDVIAEKFPEVKTGDLDPMTTMGLSAEQEKAVHEWLTLNGTKLLVKTVKDIHIARYGW